MQNLLGNEFEAAAAFLGRTGDLAKRYPCPHPNGAGCPRHVLTEADGSIRAACGSESKECDSVALLRDDVEVLRFDNASFVVALQQVFGISETSSNVEVDGDIAPVGTIRDASGRRRPVVLLMPSSPDAAQALVAEMERAYPQGAILLTPTDEFVTPESEGRLDGTDFAWHTLSDLIVLDDRKLAATRGLECETRRADAVPQNGNLFRREQDTWLLSFAGKEVHIHHLVGLGYLADVLRSPRREIEALVLVGSQPENLAVDVGPGIELADDKAIRDARNLLKERQAVLAGLRPNDWAKRGQLEEEIGKIESYLGQTKTVRGTARKAGGQAEKARKAVGGAISGALRKIHQRHPELAQHLRDSIRKGKTVAYLPQTTVDWDF